MRLDIIGTTQNPKCVAIHGSPAEVKSLRCCDWDQIGRPHRSPTVGVMPATPLSLKIVRAQFPKARATKKLLLWYGEEMKKRELLATTLEGALFCNDGRLHDFQRAGVSFLKSVSHNHRVLLGDDPRLGKTVQSLVAMEGVYPIEPIFIFTMKSLIDQWHNEVKLWTSFAPVAVYDEKRGVRERLFWHARPGQAIITNWEALRTTRMPRIRYLIGDECHIVRNRKAQVTKRFIQLRPEVAFLMSATMTEHGPQDYFTLLRVLRPKEFTSYWRFVTWYCQTQFNGFGHDIVGSQNEDVLQDHLAPFSLRRRASEVADIPEKQFKRIVIEPSPKLMQAYNEIKKEVVVEIGDTTMTIPNALARTVRLRQVSISPRTLGYDFDSPKVAAIIDYIARLPEDMQVVVYTSFRDSAREIVKALPSATLWIGDEPDPQDFVAGETRALVCTPQLGGVGRDFSNADVIIYADLPESSTILRQSMERTTKMGMKKPRLIVSAVCTPIDYAIAEALEAKQETIKETDIYQHILEYL